MLRINSPRTKSVVGNITPNFTSVNILRVAENSQKDYLNQIIVLYVSGEVGYEEGSTLTINSMEINFYGNVEDAIEQILLRDIYPHDSVPFLDNEKLDVSFCHEGIKAQIYSNYMFFSREHYEEIKNAMLEVCEENRNAMLGVYRL